MLFNSLHFMGFFPVVTFLFFALPRAAKLPFLLLASCYFYVVFIPKFIFILFFLIAVDYLAAIAIENAKAPNKKPVLIISLIANLGVLALFKYFNFFNQNLTQLAQFFHINYNSPTLHLILPIGLSFHTFQSMSYTIEVYKGRQKAERNLLVYSLYVLFYPQMVAGPIERPQHLLHQFHREFRFDFFKFFEGIELMTWGFFKKVFVADRLAEYVAVVFRDPTNQAGGKLAVLGGVYFFALQIYCDFSGYTDIARGAAKCMGFELMENFNNPYAATSIADFWHRWHISLSTWFRDYLYIPLGGNRVKPMKGYVNILIVFVLSGLWHGANWTFIIWGLIHGAYLCAARWIHFPLASMRNLKGRLFFQRFLVFQLVSFAWIFFRAESLTSSNNLILSLIQTPLRLSDLFKFTMSDDVFRTGLLALTLFFIFAWLRIKAREEKFYLKLDVPHFAWRTLAMAFLFELILLGAPLNETAFIYFQF